MARFLVVNGVLQAAPPPPVAVVLESVSGVYTTTRTDGDASVVLFWERHLRRLANSARILAESGGFSGSRFVLPPPSKFQALVDDSLRVGLRRAMENRNEEGSREEVVITVMVDRSDHEEEGSRGIDVIVHLGPYVPAALGKGARLALAGRGRDMAEAKRTEWVRIRKRMEKLRGPATTEMLLSNDGDRILEGTLTNFFVVCRRKDVSAGTTESSCDWEDRQAVEVQTAPVRDGVLPGIIRELVSEICSKRGINFRESAPSWAERERWEECFITNSLRILEHVEMIQVPSSWEGMESKSWEDVSWEEKRFEGPGVISALIKKDLTQAAIVQGLSLAGFL